MVIAQLGVSAGDALALLKAHAYAHSVSLTQISSDVSERRLDFLGSDPDPDPAEHRILEQRRQSVVGCRFLAPSTD